MLSISDSVASIFETYRGYIVISFFTGFVIYVANLAYTDIPPAIKTTSYANTMMYYLLLIILPSVALFLYLINLTIGNDLIQPLFIFFAVSMSGLLILFVLLYSGLSKYIFNPYLLYFLIVAIFIVALSIIYNIFSGNLRRSDDMTGFIINFIFYIPCLVSDFANYLFNDFKSTQSSVFFLFIIELLLILAYFFVLPRADRFLTGNGITLLKNPVFISKRTNIGESFMRDLQNREQPPDTIGVYGAKSTSLIDSPYKYKYAISMWIYLNPMPSSRIAYSNNNETTIFNYSDINGNGHPMVTYINNSQGIDSYKIYFSNNAVHSIQLPHQKWNNFVFNYNGNSVDVFVNGNLERAFIFSENSFPVYKNSDVIYVGSETDDIKGLYGSICNVVYYPAPMTKHTIVTNYNLLSINNPPLLSI